VHAAGLVALAAALLFPADTRAQPQVAPQILPGTQPPPVTPPEPKPKPTPPVLAPKPLGQPIPPDADRIVFTLKDVVLTGTKFFQPADFRDLWAKRVGQRMNLRDVYALARAMSDRVYSRGYVLSHVVVPGNPLKAGVVRLQVVEGYIAEVRFEGQLNGRRELLDGMAERIKQARPLTAATLERYLLLMNDLSGVFAGGIISPLPSPPGAARLQIQVAQTKLVTSASVDNRISEVYGSLRGSASLDLNSPLGRFERHSLSLSTTFSDRLNAANYFFEAPLNAEGLKAGFYVGGTWTHPDLRLVTDYYTQGYFYGVFASYPFLRSRDENLYFRISLTGFDGYADVFGTELFKDRVRAVRPVLAYDKVDRWAGINTVELGFSQGLQIFNASNSDSPLNSQPGANADFTKTNLYAARLQQLGRGWSLLSAAQGQYSGDRLYAVEQLALGGEQFLRAYNTAEFIGDKGFAAKLEARYQIEPTVHPVALTLYGYYDYGKLWQNVQGVPSFWAASAGGGVRYSLGAYTKGYFELAKPINQDVQPEGNRDWRLFAGLAFWYFK
jgi:hemolysin activation/secretion protein